MGTNTLFGQYHRLYRLVDLNLVDRLLEKKVGGARFAIQMRIRGRAKAYNAYLGVFEGRAFSYVRADLCGIDARKLAVDYEDIGLARFHERSGLEWVFGGMQVDPVRIAVH